VKLQNSGGDATTLAANGMFNFSTKAPSGTGYAVTVLTQPTGQTCLVTGGSGTVSGANVSSIQVACATNKYTISGTVSGLRTGAQVIVQNDAGDTTQVKTNGVFSFAAPILYNGSYSVSVVTQPPAQACTVSDGSGTGVTANVTGVTVTCGPAAESVIHSFNENLYGTANGGAANGGTVFKITTAGALSVLHSFTFGHGTASNPSAGLIEGADGNFYGTAASGGGHNAGAIAGRRYRVQSYSLRCGGCAPFIHGRRWREPPCGAAGPGHRRQLLHHHRKWRSQSVWQSRQNHTDWHGDHGLLIQ